MQNEYLKRVGIFEEDKGGLKLSSIHGRIRPLRRGYYKVLPIPVGGDAPKDFIQVYTYGEGRRISPKTWPKFIAKVGHK